MSTVVSTGTSLRETRVLDEKLSQASQGFGIIQSYCGVGEDGWVATEDYETAMASLRMFMEGALRRAESVEERE